MNKFQDYPLSEPLLRAIAELGFETPSPIQAETLPLLLGQETDFLGLAATGTGKTAAFALPLLERIDPNKKGVQALILCPTRELAIQVCGQIALLGKYKKISALPVYGGAGYGDQIRGLKSGVPIVVGTPGRVVDHIEKGTLDLQGLETLILDEADEMISMGFKEDLEFVLSRAPKGQANTWLFSATMGREVRHVADSYLKNPKQVQVNRTEMLPTTVEQMYFMTHEYDKPELLRKVIDTADDFYGIVFCQTKSLVTDLTQFLVSQGYKADCLHGDIDQTGRDRVMRAFREKKIAVLIATDVACRGLDVKDITHVINYSIPRELDNYVHRIGRTGRSGKTGIAISFVTNSHRQLIGRIEGMTKTRLKEGRMPSLRDVALRKVAKAQRVFTEQGPQGRMTELVGEDWQTAVQELSKEEIIGRFITLLHPELAAGASEVRAGPLTPREPSRERAPRERDRAPRERDSYPARSVAKPLLDPKPAVNFTEAAPGQIEKPKKSEFKKAEFKSKPDFKSEPKPEFKSEFKSDFKKPPFKKREFKKPDFKTNEKRMPPWERKSGPDTGDKPFRSFAKKSTPWGSKVDASARPKSKWTGEKKPFSAREASEGKSKPFRKWDSRPTKPSR